MFGATCIDKDGRVVRKLYQWDVDQVLKVDIQGYTFANNVAEIHFCNSSSESAKVVKATVEGTIVSAAIPNSLLREAKAIFAYINVTESGTSSRTIVDISMPVVARKKPDDYLYTDDLSVIRLDKKIAEADAVIAKFEKFDIDHIRAEIRRLDGESKALDAETKRLDEEAKRLDAETKRLDVEAKRLDTEVQKLGVEKFNKDCGVANAGKIVAVGADGVVAPLVEIATTSEIRTYLGL